MTLPPTSEIDREEVERMAEVLEINAPAQETAEERRQWVAWWKLSYEAALTLPDDKRAYLKSGGWWPPLSASRIGVAPEIVQRTVRPGLFVDPSSEREIAAFRPKRSKFFS